MGYIITQIACYDKESRSCCGCLFFKRNNKKKGKKDNLHKLNNNNNTIPLARLVNTYSENEKDNDLYFVQAVESPLTIENNKYNI